MKFGIKDIGPIALSLGIAVIVISVVAMILGQMGPQTYMDRNVPNETFNANSDPYTYTVNRTSEKDFVDLTKVTCYESTSQDTELSDNDCNISDAEAGKVKISTTVDSGDESLEYNYAEETQATSVVEKGEDAMATFGDWFNILVIVSVSAIVLGLVMLFRGTTGGTKVSQ